MVVDGAVVVRPAFNFGLSWDRRVMAGAQAARFFRRVVDILLDATSALD
jgi:pyruvate/2-oxoglutarate dehydrogenase complex dihydrolipoamide acyltransferase (E2) component